MRILPSLAFAAVLLAGCGLPAKPIPQQPAPPAPIAASPWDQNETTQHLNVLINDTDPASPDWPKRQKEITRRGAGADIPGDLRMAVNEVAAFAPPRFAALRGALLAVDERTNAERPAFTNGLDGAIVERRLGPALYIVRLPGGDTAFFRTERRLKNGAELHDIPVMEEPRPKANPANGDLVDTSETARTFAEPTSADRLRRRLRLRDAAARRARIDLLIGSEMNRLDNLARSVNAVLGPRLLSRRASFSTAALVRKVGRMAHTWSRWRYYRYAVPVTGRPGVDAILRAYLENRRKAIRAEMRSLGQKTGRAHVDEDIITFKTFTAAPQILSIRFEELHDTGGAHPEQHIAAFTFDMASQKRIGLSDIFNDLPTALSVLSELSAQRLGLRLGNAAIPAGYAPEVENFAQFVLDGGNMEITFPAGQAAGRFSGRQMLRVPLSQPRLLPLLTPSFTELLNAAATPAPKSSATQKTQAKTATRQVKRRQAGRHVRHANHQVRRHHATKQRKRNARVKRHRHTKTKRHVGAKVKERRR